MFSGALQKSYIFAGEEASHLSEAETEILVLQQMEAELLHSEPWGA